MKSVGLFCLVFSLSATFAAAQTADGDGPGPAVFADPQPGQDASTVFPVVRYLTPTGSPVYQPLLAARSRLVAVADPMAADYDLGQFLFFDSLSQSEIYLGTFAAIDTRLQLGAPPMSPVLVGQWNEAQAALDQIETNVTQLKAQMPIWPSHAARLETVTLELQAFGDGKTFDGMDEVNDRQLREDAETLRLFGENWLADLSAHVVDQSSRLAAWRSDLAELQARIIAGNDQPATGALGAGLTDGAGRTLPLFVVTFDRPGVVFEDQLRRLLDDLERAQTGYKLDIVAVAEKHKDPEQQDLFQNEALQFTQAVIRALERFGLDEDRYRLTDAILETRIGSEVRVFLRPEDLEQADDTVEEVAPTSDPAPDETPG